MRLKRLKRAWKPGFSPDTSVFSALETFVIIALYKSTFTIQYHTIKRAIFVYTKAVDAVSLSSIKQVRHIYILYILQAVRSLGGSGEWERTVAELDEQPWQREAERRVRPARMGSTVLVRYAGHVPWKTECMTQHSLNWMRQTDRRTADSKQTDAVTAHNIILNCTELTRTSWPSYATRSSVTLSRVSVANIGLLGIYL